MKYLGLIWSNLGRKKLRTTLTLLSIAVAFLLFGLLCVLKEAFLGGVALAGADRLVVRHKVSIIQALPISYLERIERIPGVTAVHHQTWFNGIYQDPKNFFGSFPVEPARFFDMFPEFKVPPEQQEAWRHTRNGALVGEVTMKRFGWKVGDHVPLTSPIWGQPAGRLNWDFEIVGVYTGEKKGTDTSGFYFRYDYFEEGRVENKGQISWFSVRVAKPDEASAVARRIDEEFANSPYETKAEPEGAFAAGFAQQLGDIGAIIVSVLGAVFFTILLVAGNTMGQAVRERTEELGVLKAVGFTDARVLVLVLVESCLLALVGGVAGLALAKAVTLGGSPLPAMLPTFYLPHRDLLTGLLLVLGLGVVAGALPAWQAMRLTIADALRRQG